MVNDVFDEYIIALFRGVAYSKKLKDVSSEFLEKNEGYEQVDEENGKVYLSLKGQK